MGEKIKKAQDEWYKSVGGSGVEHRRRDLQVGNDGFEVFNYFGNRRTFFWVLLPHALEKVDNLGAPKLAKAMNGGASFGMIDQL